LEHLDAPTLIKKDIYIVPALGFYKSMIETSPFDIKNPSSVPI